MTSLTKLTSYHLHCPRMESTAVVPSTTRNLLQALLPCLVTSLLSPYLLVPLPPAAILLIHFPSQHPSSLCFLSSCNRLSYVLFFLGHSLSGILLALFLSQRPRVSHAFVEPTPPDY